ncbi:B12-binding domain-containing radical SAM protein [Stappia sp. ES.058]|uniref:B12-binding domain-containing radical SAM protein n=1 Tax=Stappia sp. ES.058 TaxID=1881061 RepID=UPI00087DCF94|nr:cobalamin-dependent protein [Stappia sp. ES.058]SDU03410.1 clorobiocin biosynthesis protein CloN6 [Stappia sp. ES.058]
MSSKVKADLILIHAPAIYDFRDRDDFVLGWYASQESSNVTPIFEMHPLGFLSIKSFLSERGLDVKIVNVASLMLKHPTLDVEKLLEHLDAPVIGLDLHWLPHCQGSVEVAGLVKKAHPESFVVFGGIVSTYYAREMMQYPQIDGVIRGYDTLEPLANLVEQAKRGVRGRFNVENMIYKDKGEVVDNGHSYTPEVLNDVAIDWSKMFPKTSSLLNMPNLMVLPNTGCQQSCGWCSGSRWAYQRMMNVEKKTVFHRRSEQLAREILTFPKTESPLSVYTLQAYSESSPRLLDYLAAVADSGVVKSVSFEQFRLTKISVLKQMVEVAPNLDIYINLSPQSHDVEISRLTGRGTYTNEEMEEWIAAAMDIGIKGVYLWYTIGMPKQTHESVMETVAYSARLMDRFPNDKIIPTIFGMVPFLDPGCQWFEEPKEHGYTVFHRDLESHRQSLTQPRWRDAMNYETRWMKRDEFLPSMYEAMQVMANHKADYGRITKRSIDIVNGRIDHLRHLTTSIDRAMDADGRLPASLRREIGAHNDEILSYAADVALVKKPLSGRWYDDHTVPREIIDACVRERAAA